MMQPLAPTTMIVLPDRPLHFVCLLCGQPTDYAVRVTVDSETVGRICTDAAQCERNILVASS